MPPSPDLLCIVVRCLAVQSNCYTEADFAVQKFLNFIPVGYELQFIDSPIIISVQNFLCTICVCDHMVNIIPELLVNDELTYVRIMSFRQGVKK